MLNVEVHLAKYDVYTDIEDTPGVLFKDKIGHGGIMGPFEFVIKDGYLGQDGKFDLTKSTFGIKGYINGYWYGIWWFIPKWLFKFLCWCGRIILRGDDM